MMTQAFDDVPLYTSLYEPDLTFPGFAEVDVRTSALNQVAMLRTRHRLAMPILVPVMSGMVIDADVLLVSSSGWAHGMKTTGRKIVYCHAPARWLYQRDRYLGVKTHETVSQRLRRAPATLVLGALAGSLRQWDLRAALTADRYVANSTATQEAIRRAYGVEADVLAPPPALSPVGAESPVQGIEPGYVLCVSRLLPYKNVDVVIDAIERIRDARLVVVGDGPERTRLSARLPGRVVFTGRVADDQLRWLYRNSSVLVAASYEDYGLSPLEAAAFGRPSVALRGGGYIDTIVEGRTGLFFDEPVAHEVAAVLREALSASWDTAELMRHAAEFSLRRFQSALRRLVAA